MIKELQKIKDANLTAEQTLAAQLLCSFRDMEVSRLKDGEPPITEATTEQIIAWVSQSKR